MVSYSHIGVIKITPTGHLQEPDDAVIRAISAAIFYTQTMLHEASGLPNNYPGSIRNHLGYMWDALIVPHQEVMLAKNHPSQLQARLSFAQKALDGYRDYVTAEQER